MGMGMTLGGGAQDTTLTACCDVRNACLMVCGSARTYLPNTHQKRQKA